MSTSVTDPRAKYLQHRAVLHETLCRVTATLVCNPLFPSVLQPCQLRRCRRNRLCSGPMLPCERLQERIRILQRVGLSSAAGTRIPLCMTAADEAVFAAFDACKNNWAQRLADNPDLRWADLAWGLRARIRKTAGPDAAPPLGGAENL